MEKFLRCLTTACAALVFSAGCSDSTEPGKPDPGPGSKYDIAVAPKYSLGTYYAPDDMIPISTFYLALSDGAMEGDAEDPIFVGAGKIVWLDIYVDTAAKELPTGTYTFDISPDNVKDFSFGAYNSVYGVSSADGTVDDANLDNFTEGELKVSRSGDTYTLVLTGKLKSGKTIYTEYKGSLKFKEAEVGSDDGFPRMDAKVQTTFIESKVKYYGLTDKDAGHFYMELSDFDSPDGYIMAGNTIKINLFSQIVDGKRVLTPGTYTVAATYADTKTYGAGQVQPGHINLETYQDLGTCLNHNQDKGGEFLSVYYGVVKSGTVKVEQSGDVYTITVDLVDENGFTTKGQYVGKLIVTDKSYKSTLTADYEVNLEGMPCEIEYYGQAYAADGLLADSWGVYIGTWKDNTEAIQMELLAPHGSFAAGLPAHEYEISITYDTNLHPYVCIPGESNSSGQLYCSWYLGGFQGGAAYKEAPFTTGTVLVDFYEGEYTFMIMAEDDAPTPHALTAEWSGTAKMIDQSKAQAPKRISKASVGPKISAVLPSQKAPMRSVVRKYQR